MLSEQPDTAAAVARARSRLATRYDGVDMSDLAARRAAYDAFSDAEPLPEGMSQTELDLGGVSSLGLVPAGESGDRILLWAHGGGFDLGSSRSHRPLAATLAHHAGAAAILPDYRRAPEHRFPAALDDLLAVYQGVRDAGIPAQRLIVGGDSAGGSLAMLLLMRLRERGADMPAGLVLFSPWVNLANTGWSYHAKAERDGLVTRDYLDIRARDYLGGVAADDPAVAVLNGDLSGLPPTYIQVGEAEVLLSDSTALAERLGAARVPVTLEVWPDMFHVWQHRLRDLPQAHQALARAGAWSRAHFRG